MVELRKRASQVAVVWTALAVGVDDASAADAMPAAGAYFGRQSTGRATETGNHAALQQSQGVYDLPDESVISDYPAPSNNTTPPNQAAPQGNAAVSNQQASPDRVAGADQTVPADPSVGAKTVPPLDEDSPGEFGSTSGAESAIEPPPPWPQTSPAESVEGETTATYDPRLVPAAYSAEAKDGPQIELQPSVARSPVGDDIDRAQPPPADRAAPPRDRRRLAPASATSSSVSRSDDGETTTPPSDAHRVMPGLPHGSVTATVAAMFAVVGLFLVSIWLIRRGLPKSSSILPDEVVGVLGRKQIGARQTVQLLKVGRKLVLVSVTPDHTGPLTEVTDAAEVDRLLGLCQQSSPYSSSAEFQQVLDQLARQPTAAGLLDRGFPPAASTPTAGAYSGRHGGHEHA